MAAATELTASELLFNGNFETGDLTGWITAENNKQPGRFSIQTGTASPINGFAVPAPPEGDFAAMSDQEGPGAHAILQPFTVPLNTIALTLSLQLFISNQAEAYFTPNSFDLDLPMPNQQARIEILTPGAGPFDLGGSIVAPVFQTFPGSPARFGYTSISADLTGILTPGESYQLRIAEVDSLSFFNTGVDQVSINAVHSPEPGSILLVSVGAAAAWLRSRRASASRGKLSTDPGRTPH